MPKICVVSDIHHGRDQGSKRGTMAGALMETFAAFCAEHQPDLVLDLGDRITDLNAEVDTRLEREAKAMFAPITAPIKHICGNHDRDYLSVADNEAALGQSLACELVPLGDWTVALWRAETIFDTKTGFVATEDQLLWLEETLAAATGPMLVASHAQVSGASMRGNYFFEIRPNAATYPTQLDRIREAIRGCAHPLVWLSGHVHWNSVNFIDGRLHITTPSLTDTITTGDQPAGAMAVLALGEDVSWQVSGRDPLSLSLPAARLMASLRPMTGDFPKEEPPAG